MTTHNNQRLENTDFVAAITVTAATAPQLA